MKQLMIFIVAMIVAPLACALTVPKPSPYDSRIQSADYNANDVFEINTKIGISTQVQFAEGESIATDKAVSGFVDGWSLVPSGNSLFIKAVAGKGMNQEGKEVPVEPVPGEWNTNILVSTNRRVYVLDLKLLSGGAKVAYLVKFKYPEDEFLRAQAEKLAKEKEVSLDKTPVVKNMAYKMQAGKKSSNIEPGNVFDDGQFTYFTFPGNREIPAIFHVNENKEESIVNSHVDPKMPGTIVVHRIGRQFNLRYGKAVVGVYNEAFDKLGELNVTGTTVTGVKRELKDQ